MHSWCRFASHSPLTFLLFCLPCSPCPFLLVPPFRTCLWLSVNPYHRARHRQGQLARLPPLRYAFTHQHPFLSILYYVPLRPTGFPSACHTHRSRRTKQQYPAPLQVAKLLFAQVCVCGETGCSNGERQKKGQQSHTTTKKMREGFTHHMGEKKASENEKKTRWAPTPNGYRTFLFATSHYRFAQAGAKPSRKRNNQYKKRLENKTIRACSRSGDIHVFLARPVAYLEF